MTNVFVQWGAKAEKEKRYRRLHKDPDDSSDTEYETIHTDSELEELARKEREAALEEVEEPVKERTPSPPDPTPWIEYNKVLSDLEEYDGDWVRHLSFNLVD